MTADEARILCHKLIMRVVRCTEQLEIDRLEAKITELEALLPKWPPVPSKKAASDEIFVPLDVNVDVPLDLVGQPKKERKSSKAPKEPKTVKTTPITPPKTEIKPKQIKEAITKPVETKPDIQAKKENIIVDDFFTFTSSTTGEKPADEPPKKRRGRPPGSGRIN